MNRSKTFVCWSRQKPEFHWTAKRTRKDFSRVLYWFPSRSPTACASPAPAPLRGSAPGWWHRFPQPLWRVVYWMIPSPWPAQRKGHPFNLKMSQEPSVFFFANSDKFTSMFKLYQLTYSQHIAEYATCMNIVQQMSSKSLEDITWPWQWQLTQLLPSLFFGAPFDLRNSIEHWDEAWLQPNSHPSTWG